MFVDGLFLTLAGFSHRKACNQPAISTTTCNQASKQTAAVFMILAHRAIPAVVVSVVVVCWLGKAERAGRTRQEWDFRVAIMMELSRSLFSMMLNRS